MTGDRRGGTKNKHAKLHSWRPSRQISSHSLQVTSGRQDRYPIRSPSRSNSESRRNTFKINQESIPNPCKFIKIQTESMKNPLEIAGESIQNPHGTNAKSRQLSHTPLGHFIDFHPWTLCRNASFSYPSRAFCNFLSLDISAGRHLFHTPLGHFMNFLALDFTAGRHLFHTPLGHFMILFPCTLVLECISFIPLSGIS